jgi:uridine phosphorylase
MTSRSSKEQEVEGGVVTNSTPPILLNKDYGARSIFQPENLLREARRQKQLPDLSVPEVCLLDPDGDIVRYLAASGRGRLHAGWACYHTDMWVVDVEGIEIGVVGMAVGAAFAVLVAEQLSASGARLTISITSAGQIRSLADPPYFILIDKALRDEGTSLHYQPPATWSRLPGHLEPPLTRALQSLPEPVQIGASWTTDAPYRETQAAIDAALEADVVCVEMEAAALYSYAAARERDVVCLAHITNTMAVAGNDFEKGHANGASAGLAIAYAAAVAVRPPRRLENGAISTSCGPGRPAVCGRCTEPPVGC